jgi:hypothetical protein
VPFKDPERRRAYQRESAQLRRAGRMDAPARQVLPDPVRVRTAQEVLELLEEQLNLLRAYPARQGPGVR